MSSRQFLTLPYCSFHVVRREGADTLDKKYASNRTFCLHISYLDSPRRETDGEIWLQLDADPLDQLK